MAHDLTSYDYIILAFSGGKDSWASALHVLEQMGNQGVERSRLELWYHEVDGHEGSHLMNWPCTPAYVRACAKALGVRLYASWKVGGFEREMLRQNALTAPIMFESPSTGLFTGVEIRTVGGQRGKLSTRRKFPQVSADLSVRWCSAYLKIDVASAALCNQERFRGKRTLFITGERAEESPGRAKYAKFEPHRSDLRNGTNYTRHIDHWRPVHEWPLSQIWSLLEFYWINPHPAYRLGYGRVSCRFCLFGSDDQWATGALIDPEGIQVLAGYEGDFGVTIHRTLSIPERVARGTPYVVNPGDVKAAISCDWTEPIFLENWQLPTGAFGESCGPS